MDYLLYSAGKVYYFPLLNTLLESNYGHIAFVPNYVLIKSNKGLILSNKEQIISSFCLIEYKVRLVTSYYLLFGVWCLIRV